MDIQNTILIEKLNAEILKLPKHKMKRRYSQFFKSGVRNLFSSGLSIKEIGDLLPISKFTIREWTKDICLAPDEGTDSGSFIKIKVEQPEQPKFSFIFKHESGFTIEVNDSISLEYLIYKLKAIR